VTRTRLAACAVLIALGLTACSDDDDDVSTARSTTTEAEASTTAAEETTTTAAGGGGGAEAGAGTVEIVDFRFQPSPLEVDAGTTVTFTNGDETTHTATSTDGPASFDTGEIGGGASGEVTVDEPGTYQYQCGIHPDMLGTIEVG
jgi:plastocyanin